MVGYMKLGCYLVVMIMGLKYQHVVMDRGNEIFSYGSFFTELTYSPVADITGLAHSIMADITGLIQSPVVDIMGLIYSLMAYSKRETYSPVWSSTAYMYSPIRHITGQTYCPMVYLMGWKYSSCDEYCYNGTFSHRKYVMDVIKTCSYNECSGMEVSRVENTCDEMHTRDKFVDIT